MVDRGDVGGAKAPPFLFNEVIKMKHGYFATIGCACLLGLALISCDPVGAVEIGVDDQTSIYDYLDTGAQNLQQIDFSLDSDEDGNRSVRLKIYGLQKLALSEQSGIYDNMDFSAAPDSVTVSGSGGVGFYRHNQNSEPIPATVFSCRPGEIMAQSEEFSITVRYGIESMNADCVPYSDGVSAGFKYTGSGYYSPVIYHDSLGFLADISQSYSIFTNDIRAYTFDQNCVPIVSRGVRCDLVSFGSGSSLTLPPGTVDTSRPWDYYNNVLLPYMDEVFPGYDEYFIFPDGFTPSEPPPQVPTEFPTLPGYDFDIQPVGTLPVGAENAAYDMPDVPVKVVPVPSFDLTKINPAEIIAPFANGLEGIWALITDTLVSYDLLPVVSLCFLVLIITAFLALGVK